MSTPTNRAWTILRHRLRDDLAGLAVAWAVFSLGVALLVAGVAVFRSQGIEVSGWEQASQLARWYAGAVGVYLTFRYLPLYIAHGYTRREFTIGLPVFVPGFAAGFALLMTVGLALEGAAYRLFGWTHDLVGTHLYQAPTQYGLVFTEYLLIGLVWTLAGAMLGAAFYRRADLGIGVLLVALLLVGTVEAAVGTSNFGPIAWLGAGQSLPVLGPLFAGASAGWALLTAAAVTAVGLALLWTLVRDLPVRNKAA